jgi:hypothetical protein
MALLALAGVAVGVALAGSPAPAASTQPSGQTFEVVSILDTVDVNPGDGVCADATAECTLRAAVQEANALPGHQTVVLPAGEYVLTRSGYEENESSVGDLDITGDLTIVGAGASDTGITEEASVDRIFDVREGVVTMRDLTIHDVFMSAILSFDETCGGGIRSAGDLTASHVVIRDNVFRRDGGGICNSGTLRVADSRIERNLAALSGEGGGIQNRPGGFTLVERTTVTLNASDTSGGGGIANLGTMIVVDSVINENYATAEPLRGGGGLSNRGSPFVGSPMLTIINSTIADNFTDAIYGGGGLSNDGTGIVTIINSTITGNRIARDDGGGISADALSTTTLINTAVAGNEKGDCRLAEDSALPQSLGHNLDSDGSCGLSGPGDLSGVDPLLGELADNGGPTLTHALLAGSPAIDAGDDAECPAADQRGAPRPSGGSCDIGAYEAGAAVPPPAALPGDVDCDGALSPYDELALLRFVGSLAAPECIELADLNCDGEAGIVDALVLLRRLAGFIDEPCNPG